MNARVWSTQQNAIFDFFINADGHLVVVARAGTGKTTTIVEAVKRYLDRFPGRRVIVCAFNTRIADELKSRFMGYAVDVKTLHAIGFSIVQKFWERIPVENKQQKGLRARGLTDAVCGAAVPDGIKKLVTRLHTLGRETNPKATHASELVDLALEHDLAPDAEWEAYGYDVDKVCAYAVAAMKLAADRRPPFIDFADMIFLPVRHGWLAKYADLVVVDEAQDMTVAQLAIAQGICRGRIAVVGDDRQAIYGFRGADSGSLQRLQQELHATELKLTITYRCGREIVAAAQTMVPDFQAGPDNPMGRILEIPETKMDPQLGDFILSRTNAPLVAVAMRLLREGKRTKVAGRNIGEGLIKLVTKLASRTRSVPEFLERLNGWQETQVARAAKSLTNPDAYEHRVNEIADQVGVLQNLADDAKSVHEINDRIEALFTDDGLGQAGVITCSSVHRAKGLEADRVFILAETLRNGKLEEENIEYVAITRAKKELVMVGAWTTKRELAGVA